MTSIAAPVSSGIAAPRWRALARTFGGRVAIVALGTAMLAGLRMPWWWVIGVILLLVSMLPQWRKEICLAAAVGWVFLDSPVDVALLGRLSRERGVTQWALAWPTALMATAVAATWWIGFAYLWIVRRFPKSPPARRPVIGLVVLLLALLAVTRAPMRGTAWVFVAAIAMAFGKYIWFFAYWVSESRDKPAPLLRTYAWRPFWGYTNVPYGKGTAYLERYEAKDDEQLAVAQLAGLKLLAMAAMWTALLIGAKWALYGRQESLTEISYDAPHGRLPTYQMALDAMLAGRPYALPVRWMAVAAYFLLWVLHFTIFGHKIVAIARLAGFNIFRNTYRPMLATSVADFYNRVYFYFKEMLVAFFFYPTYLRYFKTRPKVRLFVATLAAAGLGNFLFHFLRDQEHILRLGLVDALIYYRAYALYALLLGVSISVSQMRILSRKGKQPVGVRRVGAIAACLIFYCLIALIEEPNDRHGLTHYGHYFVGLFRP